MNKTKWTGQECPPNYTVKHNAGQLQLTLYTDIKEETTSEGVKQWTATQIFMPVGVTDYGSIVSAIINSHYSNDEMDATMNNYLQETDLSTLIELLRNTQNFNKLRHAMSTWLDGRDESAVSEYADMQNYRKYAKQTARQITDEIEGRKG